MRRPLTGIGEEKRSQVARKLHKAISAKEKVRIKSPSDGTNAGSSGGGSGGSSTAKKKKGKKKR
jgi:hypothetical protein